MSTATKKKPLKPANRVAIASGQRTDLDVETVMAYRAKWEADGFDLPPWNPPLPSKATTIKNAGKAVGRTFKRAVTGKKVYVSKVVADERLAICNNCPTNQLRESDRRCAGCTCYVDEKVKYAGEFCPDDHWAAVEVPRRKKRRVGGARAGRRKAKPRSRNLSPRINGRGRVRSHHGMSPISNLILSTAFGPDPTGTPIKTVSRIPFNGKPVCNLIYHIYPAGGDRWKRNLDWLLERIDVFNGRRIVGIVTDRSSADETEVRKYLGTAVHEYLIYRNNKGKDELVTFVPLLAQLETYDPNQITFRAHAKGVSQATDKAAGRTTKHLMDWARLLYEANLDDIDLVTRQLELRAVTGACRKYSQFTTVNGNCTYSGSFFWFRNCYVYSRNWRTVYERRFGSEEWPGRMFRAKETACTFLDNTGSMYDPGYWHGTVMPSFEKWKQERGL